MTEEEFGKLSFHLVSHISLAYVHTRKKKNGDFGRSYTHYRIDKQVYKQKEKFIEALKDFDINKGVVKTLYGG